jgi:hypothetical protein
MDLRPRRFAQVSAAAATAAAALSHARILRLSHPVAEDGTQSPLAQYQEQDEHGQVRSVEGQQGDEPSERRRGHDGDMRIDLQHQIVRYTAARKPAATAFVTIRRYRIRGRSYAASDRPSPSVRTGPGYNFRRMLFDVAARVLANTPLSPTTT